MKWLGLILIFFSTTSVGFIKANRYKDSEREINAFIRLIYFIKHEISLYLTPQSEIYTKFSSPPLEKNGFMTMLRELSAKGAQQPMLTAVTECDFLKCGEETKGFGGYSGINGTPMICPHCMKFVIVSH